MRPLVMLVGGMWISSLSYGGEANQILPLTLQDFIVAGIGEGADSAAVRDILGVADSVVILENPFDPGGTLASYVYRDVTVHFGYSGVVLGVMLTGPVFATHRGLKVGDTPTRVLELYGEPEYRSDDEWQFSDPANPEGLHVILIEFTGARVARIYVGWLLD